MHATKRMLPGARPSRMLQRRASWWMPLLSSGRMPSRSERRSLFSFAAPKSLVKSHTESKVVPFSAEEMFDVVADVNKYKDFLPFCVDSRVLRKPNDNVMEAVLRIGFNIFTESYTSRVIMNRPNKIVVKSIESPTFKRIESEWVFHNLQSPNTCKVDFKVTFEVASFLHANAIQLFFDDVAVTQLNAFIARARKVHGNRPRQNVVQTPSQVRRDEKRPTSAKSPSLAASNGVGAPMVTSSVQNGDTSDANTALMSQVSNAVKHKMASQDYEELRALFYRHADLEGRMDFNGFSTACRNLGARFPDFKEIAENSALAGAIFSSFETSTCSKDWLDLDEFAVGVYLMTKGTVEEKAMNLFQAIDTSHDGKISREELTYAMQRRIRTVKNIFPTLLEKQVAHQMENENVESLPSSADEAIAKGLEAIEDLMGDIEKEIPLAVNQIFLEADLDQDDFITEDEWLFAWQAHPEFVELMTIDGMRKVAQWASVVHSDDESEDEKHYLESRLTYVD